MAKTKVLTAPYAADGSLLHYPGDGHQFSHYEDADGNRVSEDDAWTLQEATMTDWDGTKHVRRRSVLRPDVKRIFTEAEWRPNEPFHATLQVSHMNHGRSAKYLTLKPVAAPLDPRTYPMFVTDFLGAAVDQGIQKGGIISGRWMVSQRGQNYGLRLAKEGE